jgi:hypothetical protein
MDVALGYLYESFALGADSNLSALGRLPPVKIVALESFERPLSRKAAVRIRSILTLSIRSSLSYYN